MKDRLVNEQLAVYSYLQIGRLACSLKHCLVSAKQGKVELIHFLETGELKLNSFLCLHRQTYYLPSVAHYSTIQRVSIYKAQEP